MQEYICIGNGTATDITVLKAYAGAFGLPVCETCKSGYICVGIGTGAMAAVHTNFLEAFATAHSLPFEHDQFE